MITGVYVEAHMKRFVKEASHEAFVIGTDAEGATTIRLRGMTEKP